MEGLFRSTRDAPPSHLRFKVESFTTLASSSVEMYESCEFEAGDHKWKLALYPNGNKNRGVKDNISLYLVLVDNNKEVLVNFTLFLFDHIRDKYLSVQDLSRFHDMKYESGFDKFVSHKIFKDPSSGYLNNDSCVFGAEVFCIKSEPKSHCLEMEVTKPVPFKYTWKVQKFSKLDKEYYCSEIFTTRGHDFQLCLYPKGYDTEKGNSVSLFLDLAESSPAVKNVVAECKLPSVNQVAPAVKNVVVEFKLRIVDQVGSRHLESEMSRCFNSSQTSFGSHDMLNLRDLNEVSGFLVNDTCVLEAEVIVLGSSKQWN